jgi:hypothetical protein
MYNVGQAILSGLFIAGLSTIVFFCDLVERQVREGFGVPSALNS